MAELLLEIGLEEIPARMIAAAEADFASRVAELLGRARLGSGETLVRSYSTPRRLAVHATGIAGAQSDAEEPLTGPAWNIAFKDGAPTPAAHAFAKKAGVAVDALTRVTTPKGEYVFATAHRAGRSAAEILVAELPREIGAIAWPKSMYWRPGKPERYVRPVKWLLALLDHAILPLAFAGVHAANLTYGHRILHGSQAVTIEHPHEYLEALRHARVMADVAVRRHTIRKALDHVTRTVTDARWREDELLVETVTHLTEWPSVVLGAFDPEYLALPEEVLVTVMRDHQKYFAVEDKSGKLAPYFLTVLNTEADQQNIIRHGNERVLRARFNDARFFWNFDQKISLDERVDSLKSVTFQKDLGTYYQKTQRTERIAERLAEKVGAALDRSALQRAVRLAKVDLTTELVKEFTELQGIVGGLYARAAGEPEKVALAIYSQYQPASLGDAIPSTLEGQLLGLADRIGTVIDMFRLGHAPSGSRDPYALRRAGNAIIKILAQSQLPLTLKDLCEAADSPQDSASTPVQSFFKERTEFYLRDVLQMTFDVVSAVLATGAADIVDLIARAAALASVRDSDDFAAIAAAFKRSKNILRQAEEKSLLAAATEVVPGLLQDATEQTLYTAARNLTPIVELLRQERKYNVALEQIATLRPHVDLFFDKVMVMVDDKALRNNRLALLSMILGEFSKIADFSEIVPAGAS